MIKLKAGCWYGWQMMPGYTDAPYFSPIRIALVEEVVDQAGMIDVKFLNALYAQGVQQFKKRLQILFRAKTYLVARIDPALDRGRTAIISKITPAWLDACCPQVAAELGTHVPASKLQLALDQAFGQG